MCLLMPLIAWSSCRVGCDPGGVSRGPTRRVRRILDRGEATAAEVARADVEADLLEHPYIGVEHVLLARLWIAARVAEREALLAILSPGVPRRWWRPRGSNSALRRRGVEEAREARRTAAARDARRSESD